MNTPPKTQPTPAETVVVLSISPTEEDHTALERIFSRPGWSSYTESKWTIRPATALESALPVLRNGPVAIVLSERDLCPGAWTDVLREISRLPDPPLLIVTARLADEYLWAEAPNIGAYDVLAKPFEAEEVIYVKERRQKQDGKRRGCYRRKPGRTDGVGRRKPRCVPQWQSSGGCRPCL